MDDLEKRIDEILAKKRESLSYLLGQLFGKRKVRLTLLAVTIIVPRASYAVTISKPHTFTAGTKTSAPMPAATEAAFFPALPAPRISTLAG